MCSNVERGRQKDVTKPEEYPKELWELVKEYAENILIKGRPNYDVPHTHGVVNWAFSLASTYNHQIINGEIEDQDQVDVTVLVTAAWLHDIGYYGQFEDVADFAQVANKKALHMPAGAKMARDFLTEHATQLLTDQQIDQIVHLIGIHDALDQIKTMSETILVEADTLGMLDVSWVHPTFKGEEALGFPSKDVTKQRFNLFRTELAKNALPEIINNFENFVIERDFNGKDPRGI